MRPPDQCLEPGQLAGGEGDDRLVGQRERVAGHRFLQRGLQLPPPDQPGAQHRLVAAPLPLARRLGGVQGQVGVPEQFVGVGTVLGRGDPDGDRGEHGPAGEHERLGERRDHPVGGRLDRRRLGGIGDEHRELIPAQPRRGVALTDQAEQPHRGGHQQLVADTVAHRVVDDLEVVEVHEQHADGRAGAAGPRRPAARSGPGTAAGWAARSARRGRPGTCSCSSSWRCSVTSRMVSTRPATVGSARRSLALTWTWTAVPSRRVIRWST